MAHLFVIAVLVAVTSCTLIVAQQYHYVQTIPMGGSGFQQPGMFFDPSISYNIPANSGYQQPGPNYSPSNNAPQNSGYQQPSNPTTSYVAPVGNSKPKRVKIAPTQNANNGNNGHYESPVNHEDYWTQLPCKGFSCAHRQSCGRAELNLLTTSRKSKTAYVINGENQNYGEWPQYVRLHIIKFSSLCGGVLISDRHVMTAAHCTINNGVKIEPKDVVVYLGEHDLNRKDQYEVSFRVISVCSASKYRDGVSDNSGTRFDFSILTLERPVQFNDHIQPACLPYDPIDLSLQRNQTRCYLMGAGLMGTDGVNKELANIVQKIRLKRVSCKSWFFQDSDRSRHCFTKHQGRGDSCNGDSGGPILCLSKDNRWTVVGIVSYGSTGCDGKGSTGWVGVYTRVRALLSMMNQECGL